MDATIRRRIAILIFIGGTIIALAWATSNVFTAHRVAQESSQRALLVEAVQLLDAYRDQHGKYPDSLERLQFTYPDGGDSSILSTLKYDSDGEHYEIIVRGAWTGMELKRTSPDPM